MASVAMSAPMVAVVAPRTPAVAQSGMESPVGWTGKRSRRPTPLANRQTSPRKRSTVPHTRGVPVISAASATRYLVAKESEPSRTRSTPPTSSTALSTVKRSRRAVTAISGWSSRRRSATTSTLGRPTSEVPKRICRWMLVMSTVSSSMTVMCPMPADANDCMAGHPRPPLPITSTWER